MNTSNNKLTTKLNPKSIQDYQKKLDEAYRELESFNYSVSHDLRAPLQYIEGFVDLLEKRSTTTQNNTESDQKVMHYIKIIKDSTEQMASMLDGLLVLSRLGRDSNLNETVDLQEVINSVITNKTLDNSDHKINCNVNKFPAVKIIGDQELLKEMFNQIIDNSIKFTKDKNNIQINIDNKINTESNKIMISIQDNGSGFDNEYKEKLFEAFQTLHNKEEYPGVGLGLTKARKIVHLHQGEISADGEVNNGAKVYITLPYQNK